MKPEDGYKSNIQARKDGGHKVMRLKPNYQWCFGNPCRSHCTNQQMCTEEQETDNSLELLLTVPTSYANLLSAPISSAPVHKGSKVHVQQMSAHSFHF